MNTQILISWLNFLAAIFMGVEYLFNAPLHNKINDWLVARMREYENYLKSTLRKELPFLNDKKEAFKFVFIIFSMLSSVGIIFAGDYGIWPFHLLIGGWSGLVLGAVSVTTVIAFTALIPDLASAIIVLIYSLFSLILRSCPKGVIAGLGFVFLLTSLSLQLAKAY